VHQVGLSLHDYIEMRCQQDIKNTVCEETADVVNVIGFGTWTLKA
jgi:hypothetical protein